MLKIKSLFLFTICWCLIPRLCGAEPPGKEISQQNKSPEHLFFGIPGEEDLILSRRGFSFGYDQKCRQALWVSYILTAEKCTGKKVRRSNRFRVDPAVRYKPVRPGEYKGSGFDKGHLAPAGDMVYSAETMKNSFYMTNISPQVPGCNRGIWKRLETQVRRWAIKEGKLCIVTGPIFKKRNRRMKKSKLPIPYAFYKVILDMTPPMKMIGFVIPNQTSKKQLNAFAVSVDQVEKLTGYDFFSNLEDTLEDHLESFSSYDQWH